MLTINKAPYITLDNYLDIDKLLNLEDEFNFLICKSWDKIRTGVWNAGGHAPDDIVNFPSVFRERDLLYYSYGKAKVDRLSDISLDRYLKHFEETSDRHGLSRFLKLKYQSFDPYNILNLRKTTSNVYAADAYSFTDADWDTYSWVDYIDEHPMIKKFILDLPFDRIGIVTVFYNEHFVPLGHHRDLNYFPYEKGNAAETFPHRQELIWFRFDLSRPFNLFDININTGKILEKVPVQGYSVFFNHHNWHGNFDPYPYSSITVKVEGRFTSEFRKMIGIDNLKYYYYE